MMAPQIQIVSDLHLEMPKSHDNFALKGYDDLILPQSSPYLALLGDIGNTKDDALFR